MPAEEVEVWAYWGNRQESAEACAERLAQMLTRLAPIDPVYSQWFQLDETWEVASKPFCAMPPKASELARIFDGNRFYKDPRYKDAPRVVWPELGFSVGAWNGRSDADGKGKTYFAAFSARPGRFDDKRSAPNHVSVEIPTRRLANGRPWKASDVKQVLLAVAEAWDATYVVVTSSQMRKIVPQEANYQYIWPFAGWLTYLASPYSLTVWPDEDIKVERFDNKAMLATLCEEPFDTDNPHHLELAKEMHSALGPAQTIWEAVQKQWDD